MVMVYMLKCKTLIFANKIVLYAPWGFSPPPPVSYLIFWPMAREVKFFNKIKMKTTTIRERTFLRSCFLNPMCPRLLTGSGRTASMRMSSLRAVWTSSWPQARTLLPLIVNFASCLILPLGPFSG
jgi:hypothetical protein